MIRRALKLLPHTEWGNRLYWRLSFRKRQGRWPNVKNPERFTDHLYRIKTDGRMLDPLYQYVTDKEYAKDYIAGVLGPGHTPDTYAVLRSDADVDGLTLNRAPCVIKPTHASGQVLIHTDAAAPIDRDLLKSWLRLDYYPAARELNYRLLTPKVIVEEFFSDGSGAVPKDYKVYCVAGRPAMILVTSGRAHEIGQSYYDTDWQRLAFTWKRPAGPDEHPPPLLAEMLNIAARLSEPFPFVRVDLYGSETTIRVGELTFCPNAGLGEITPDSADLELGQLFEM